jgi:sulfate transport system substrate-binding protein
MSRNRVALFAAALICVVLMTGGALAQSTLLNVSYDVSRELYREINPAFVAAWKAKTGESITIRQSHGASSTQALAVTAGLEADVVTMNQAPDIDVLVERGGLVAPDWRKLFPWGYAVHRLGGEEAARDFVSRLFANVPVLDGGGRGATTTFMQRDVGDVLVTFENEAIAIGAELGADKFDVVYPLLSIEAAPPVAIVDKVVDRRGSRRLATAYLEFLFSPEGQEIVARHAFRPRDEAVLQKFAGRFPAIKTFSVERALGSWPEVLAKHFADGGIYDQIMAKR